MKNGECPKCGKRNVYRCYSQQGGGVSSSVDGPQLLFVKDAYTWRMTKEWETFLCIECGYYENYILDKDLMVRLTVNSENSVWKKVGS